MALSSETLIKLEQVKKDLDDFYGTRLAEVDRECRNLREYTSPLSSLGERTTEAGASEALTILRRVGVPIDG